MLSERVSLLASLSAVKSRKPHFASIPRVLRSIMLFLLIKPSHLLKVNRTRKGMFLKMISSENSSFTFFLL